MCKDVNFVFFIPKFVAIVSYNGKVNSYKVAHVFRSQYFPTDLKLLKLLITNVQSIRGIVFQELSKWFTT